MEGHAHGEGTARKQEPRIAAFLLGMLKRIYLDQERKSNEEWSRKTQSAFSYSSMVIAMKSLRKRKREPKF